MKPLLTKKITKHIQDWAATLGISDYTFSFNLRSDKEMNGDYARVDTDDATREVTVDFNRTRLAKEPNEVEKTVIHELLHTRFNEYADYIIDIIKTYVNSPNTKRLLVRRAEKLEHKIVVALTEALAKEK